MSLNINKRLRYFNTEAEYLAYVEAQRAATEAGTLELMETTVCCIKHNDDTTPDEYHPSTEAGYTDVVFNYNEDDDIRYVPFINPMWTSRLCTLYPITDGYRPVLFQNAELPNVIDGQQITYIDNDFTTHLLNRWPDFSITNVTGLEFKPVNSSTRLTLPSSWPNLETIAIQCSDGISYKSIPIFGSTNTLNAPKLVNFSISNTSSNYIYSAENFPKITSDKLETFSAVFTSNYQNPETVRPLNLDDIILDSSSLTTLNLSFYNSTNNDDVRVPSIKLTHDGPSLSISNIYLSHDTTDATKGVALNITTEASIVNCNSLVLCCDFNNSTCSCPLSVKRLITRNCSSTASSSTTWDSYITHTSTSLRASFPQMYYFYDDCSDFTNITVDLSTDAVVPTDDNCYHVYVRTNTPNKILTVNMPESSTHRFWIRELFSGSSILDTLIINLPTTTPYKYNVVGLQYPYVITLPATNLIVNGELWSTSTSIQMYDDYSITDKIVLKIWGLSQSSLAGFSGNLLKYFHLYSHSVNLRLDTDTPSGVEITLCPTLNNIPEPTTSPYTTHGSLSITATANTPTLTIHADPQEYGLDSVKLYIEDPTSSITIDTVKVILDTIDDLKTSYPNAFSNTNSVVRIHRTFYNQLSASYITILNYFHTVNIIES